MKKVQISLFELFLEAKQQQPEKSTSNKWFSAEYVLQIKIHNNTALQK